MSSSPSDRQKTTMFLQACDSSNLELTPSSCKSILSSAFIDCSHGSPSSLVDEVDERQDFVPLRKVSLENEDEVLEALRSSTSVLPYYDDDDETDNEYYDHDDSSIMFCRSSQEDENIFRAGQKRCSSHEPEDSEGRRIRRCRAWSIHDSLNTQFFTCAPGGIPPLCSEDEGANNTTTSSSSCHAVRIVHTDDILLDWNALKMRILVDNN